MDYYNQSVLGYPTFVCWEGEAYCVDCANEFAHQEDEDEVDEDERIFTRPAEAGIAQAINWEIKDLYCSSLHGCGERIEPAYDDD